MSGTYLSPSLSFYKHARSNNIKWLRIGRSRLSVSANLEYCFRFLVLCWLACFSNTCFMPRFASQVATTPIPVSLWLGSRVVRLKYCTHLEKNKPASEEQWNLFCHLHCCYPTQGRKHSLPLLLLKQLIGLTSTCSSTCGVLDN